MWAEREFAVKTLSGQSRHTHTHTVSTGIFPSCFDALRWSRQARLGKSGPAKWQWCLFLFSFLAFLPPPSHTLIDSFSFFIFFSCSCLASSLPQLAVYSRQNGIWQVCKDFFFFFVFFAAVSKCRCARREIESLVILLAVPTRDGGCTITGETNIAFICSVTFVRALRYWSPSTPG